MGKKDRGGAQARPAPGSREYEKNKAMNKRRGAPRGSRQDDVWEERPETVDSDEEEEEDSEEESGDEATTTTTKKLSKATLDESEDDDEDDDSDEEAEKKERKAKGLEGIIDVENPNRVKQRDAIKVSEIAKVTSKQPELNRKER
jgi:hypothetical protein